MACFLKNNEILERDRHYWKMTKLLPEKGIYDTDRSFKLNSKIWLCRLFVLKESLTVCIINFRIKNDSSNDLLAIRVGLIGDDRKEIHLRNVRMGYIYRLCNRSHFDSILTTNKTLYLFVDVRLKDENIQKLKIRKQKMETDFLELLLSGKNSDVTIQVKGKKFYCHRCILGARSPVFDAMMEHDVKVKMSDVMTIEDVDPAAFQEFLLYLYSGNDDYLCWNHITDLYKLAYKYSMEDMKNICKWDIKENIISENFCEFFKLSQLYNDLELIEATVQFFLKESKAVLRSENWKTFRVENPVESNMLMIVFAINEMAT